MWAPLALGMLALAAPLQETRPGEIVGEVRSERTGEPVPFAVVELAGSFAPLVASADSLGRYRLSGIPAGRRLVRAHGADHAPLEIELLVPAGREVRVDFTLRLQPVVLPGLMADGRSNGRSAEGNTGATPELGRAVVRTLEATPGVAELGLVELGRTLQPGQEPADPGEVLYVRGAPADLKLVLLDGAPVYSPFHAGGLLQAFEPELVRRADLYLGGAPARYDGGLSYVLDLETRGGDQGGTRSSGSLDLLTARGVLEGPLGGPVRALVSARAVHGLGASLFRNGPFPYGYGDALGRIDLSLGGHGTLGVTGFWNQESVALIDGLARARGEDASWGNRAGSLRYRGELLGRDVEFTVATGLYRARLPLEEDDGWRRAADGSSRQTRVVAAFSDGDEPLRVDYGFTFERIGIEQRASSVAEMRRGTGGEEPELGTTTIISESEGSSGGIFADLSWSPATRVRVRGGLRADLYSAAASLRVAPRLAVTWVLSGRAVLTVAGGRYRQLVRGTTEMMTDSAGFSVGVVSASSIALARSSHLLVSLDQLLADEVRFGIEGYFKRFEGVPSPDGPDDANASGIDLWLRRGEGRITGWIGYSLGWIWTTPTGGPSTDLFSGRHLLSLGVSGEVGAGGQLGVKVGYGAGLPYTSLPASPKSEFIGYLPAADERAIALQSARELVVEASPVAKEPGPDRPYLRLDAEVSYPWEARWGGAKVTIMPYLKVYNALGRRDSFFYHRKDGEQGAPRPLAALPILPVLGVQWRF